MIRIANYDEESIMDGEGIRFVLFCQGCSHHCKGCHNPSTWSYDAGYLISPEEIKTLMDKNELLDGITLSGGEPFDQPLQLLELVKILKPKYNIWAYTGYYIEELMKDKDKYMLLKEIDYLVDGPFILEQRSLALQFRGSKNQRIINVQEALKKEGH